MIPKLDAMGNPDPTQQGTISAMRIRSGMIPNVMTLGFRTRFGQETTLKAQVSLWGTIESPLNDSLAGRGQFPRPGGRSVSVRADFREAYLQLEGPWGGVTAGRFLGLFSRGSTQMDFLYGHGYGVGFPGVIVANYVAGSVSMPGPVGGMAGFGVLSPAYAAGITYSTPSLSGIQLTAGLFEPAQLDGAGWNTNRIARPEGELTYDLAAGTFKMHLFGNGAYQKLYIGGTTQDTTTWGAGYGGRVEIGPVHIGAAGHVGTGVGLFYAFDASGTSSSKGTDDAGMLLAPGIQPFELRKFSGVSVLAQVVAGPFDINAGFGQTQVQQTAADKIWVDSVLKSQTGISAGVVYHVMESFHLDVDFMNTSFQWYGGEKQKVNFLNAGAVVTF
jgi:hypothetical protein